MRTNLNNSLLFLFKKATLSIPTILFISCLLFSCVSKKKYNELGQEYEHVENELIRVQKEKKRLEKELILRKKLGVLSDVLPVTYCKFEETFFDFGEVEIGKTYTHTFVYQNMGDNPLVFAEVKGSCTCTASQWSQEILKPNEKGEITITFTPEFPEGDQERTITILSNSKKNEIKLRIKAKVRKTIKN